MKKILSAIIFLSAALNIQAQYKTTPIVGTGADRVVNPYHYRSQRSGTFSNASVSCAHPLAAMIGTEIMKNGGNAFDAMIATQLALAVVYPEAGNLGGGGFLVAHSAFGNKNISIDYRETAPAKATKDMYLDQDGNPNLNLSQAGHLASGVPGTVAGIFATYQYARLPMRILIQPAIDLADSGFVITEREANNLNNTKASFQQNSTTPTAFVKETPWKAGDTLVQKELAKTLKRIRDNGEKGFYEGPTAKLLVEEMHQGNGIITLDDLKNYKAKVRTALQFNYKNYTIVGMPPPSSGGILVWQMMKMIEHKPITQYGFESTKAVQLMVEAERRAFADRAEHLGDPDFFKVPIKTMGSDAYIAARMKDYDSTKATPSTNVKAGVTHESDQTTHISIIDKEGDMVSVTTTLNGGYGSRVVVGGAGFLLNNEMDDFSVKPGVPNMYGAIGGTANAIQPGKRMLSSMTPTLVLKNEQPYIVCGTPGGTTIPTSVFQTLVDMLDFNMTAREAIDQPKFHHQWLPDQVDVEKGFPDNVRKELEAMGYTVKERGAIGRMEVIQVLTKQDKRTITRTLDVAADTRGDDSVAGY